MNPLRPNKKPGPKETQLRTRIVAGNRKDIGALAQLVEHHNGIVGVSGSTPLRSTKILAKTLGRPENKSRFTSG